MFQTCFVRNKNMGKCFTMCLTTTMVPIKLSFDYLLLFLELVMNRILTYVSDLKNNLSSGYEFT